MTADSRPRAGRGAGTDRRPCARRRPRAQAHTLEAVAAAGLLLASVLFALQATALTPLSASTSSQSLESQGAQAADGVLAAAAANGSLDRSLRYVNASNGTFHDTGRRGYYVSGGPPTALGTVLNRTLHQRGYAYNVNVHYVSVGGERRTEQLVHFGAPTDQASAVSRTVTLYDDDPLLDADGEPTNTTLADAETFYAPDRSPTSRLYAVVRVEVVVWRL